MLHQKISGLTLARMAIYKDRCSGKVDLKDIANHASMSRFGVMRENMQRHSFTYPSQEMPSMHPQTFVTLFRLVPFDGVPACKQEGAACTCYHPLV